MPQRAQRYYSLTDQLQVQLRALEESPAEVDVRVLQSLPDEDIEALAFLVVMQASQSAKEDLKAVMAKVKAINRAKAALRATRPTATPDDLDLDGMFQLTATLCVKSLEAEVAALIEELDGVSELGELQMLRLQMAMDRLSKLMSTLSNLLRKMSDTAAQVVKNIR